MRGFRVSFLWTLSIFLLCRTFVARGFTLVGHYRQRTRGFAMASTTESMTFIDSISDIADDYDLFLLDMWGVMHDGSKPYASVLETVKKLKENGKEMIILSNSSKRSDSSVRSLKKLGFDTSDFSQIITSGEVS